MDNKKETASPQKPSTVYHATSNSRQAWSALIACIGFLAACASLQSRSLAVTFSTVFGFVAVWFVGYWLLSKSQHFISPSTAGYKDLFETREVRFDDLRSIVKRERPKSSSLDFIYDAKTVSMPLDPLDDSWLQAIRAEAKNRGIPFSVESFGVKMKDE